MWQQNDDLIIVMPPGTEEEIKNVGPDRLSFLHAVDEVGGRSEKGILLGRG